MSYSDSHVEFIHHPSDLEGLDLNFLKQQITPELINTVKPELLFLAVFVDPTPGAWERMKWVIEQYQTVAQKNDWQIVQSKKDLSSSNIKVIFHVEDLFAIDQDLHKIDYLFTEGIRSIGITHNHENQFCGGTLSPEIGLKPLGAETISYLISKGMIHDFAHLSKQGFLDVIEHFGHSPFVSHTGIAGVYPTPRNFPDQFLKIVGSRQGYVGCGLAGSFLKESEPTTKEDYLEQISYASEMAGSAQVGIGSDLGGVISYLAPGLHSIKELAFFLEKENLGDITSNNLLHFVHNSTLQE